MCSLFTIWISYLCFLISRFCSIWLQAAKQGAVDAAASAKSKQQDIKEMKQAIEGHRCGSSAVSLHSRKHHHVGKQRLIQSHRYCPLAALRLSQGALV